MDKDIIQIHFFSASTYRNFQRALYSFILPLFLVVLLLLCLRGPVSGLFRPDPAAGEASLPETNAVSTAPESKETDVQAYTDSTYGGLAGTSVFPAADSLKEDASDADTVLKSPAEKDILQSSSVSGYLSEEGVEKTEAALTGDAAVQAADSYSAAERPLPSSIPVRRSSTAAAKEQEDKKSYVPYEEAAGGSTDLNTFITMDEIDQSVLNAAMARVYNPTVDCFWDCLHDFYCLNFPPGPIDEERGFYAHNRSQISALGRFLYADWGAFPERRDMAPGDDDGGAEYYVRREGDVYFVSVFSPDYDDTYDPMFTRPDAVHLCSDGSADIRIAGLYDTLYNVHVIKEFSPEDGRYILRLQDVTPLR